jgi:hypothetical protein
MTVQQVENRVTPLDFYGGGSHPASYQGTGDIAVSDSMAFNGNSYQSFWSPGNTIIVTPEITPKINQKWELLSIGFVGYLTVRTNTSCFGKLGAILGGLPSPSNNGAPTPKISGTFTDGPSVSANGVMLPLPNPNLSVPLWTPDSDPLPPTYNPAGGAPPTLPVSATLQLPNPIDLYDGYPLSVGVWIKPSLLGTPSTNGAAYFEIDITALSFTLTYEDGL